MSKEINRICPKCNELYAKLEVAKISLGAPIQFNMMCNNGHKWSEFYTLIYTGYWWDNNLYDAYGLNVINDNSEEIKKGD